MRLFELCAPVSISPPQDAIPQTKQRVFIGSSSEAKALMRKIATWLEDAGVTALRWNDTNVFRPGDFVFDRLAEHAQIVDGAILIFTGDDQVWYRDNKVSQPRDNVLLEYGLLSAGLGRRRAIVCRSEDPRVPTDLDGIVHVQIRANDGGYAKRALQTWARELPPRIAERYAASPDEIELLVRHWKSNRVDDASMTERLIGLGVPSSLVDGFLVGGETRQ